MEITEDNEGRFLIKEMKAPDGYHGKWEKEITLERDRQILELEAVNKPEQLSIWSDHSDKKRLKKKRDYLGAWKSCFFFCDNRE